MIGQVFAHIVEKQIGVGADLLVIEGGQRRGARLQDGGMAFAAAYLDEKRLPHQYIRVGYLAACRHGQRLQVEAHAGKVGL